MEDLPPYDSVSPSSSAFPPSAEPKSHPFHFPRGQADYNGHHHSHWLTTAVITALSVVCLMLLCAVVWKLVKKFRAVPGPGVELVHMQQEEREDPGPSSPASHQEADG